MIEGELKAADGGTSPPRLFRPRRLFRPPRPLRPPRPRIIYLRN